MQAYGCKGLRASRGSKFSLADPIFQGLAIALMAGEVASLLISRMAVPVLYYMFKHRRHG